LEEGRKDAELTLNAQEAWNVISSNPEQFYYANGELDYYRSQIELDDVSNVYWPFLNESRVWNKRIAKTNISAGKGLILRGDTFLITNIGGYDLYKITQGNSDQKYFMAIDLGEKKIVTQVVITNRKDLSTNYNPGNIIIWAPQESSPDFNPFLSTSYSVALFSGIPSPTTNSAGTQRYASIAGTVCRYLLIEFDGNYWQNSAYNTNVVFGDIDVITRSAQNCSEVVQLGHDLSVDLDKDCYVGLSDLAIFSGVWAQQGPSLVADINGDGIVDFLDFAEMAMHWLSCNDPTNMNCF
jgi:hypothetical protein